MVQCHESMLTLITPKHGTLFVKLMQGMGRLSLAMDGLAEENSEAEKDPIALGYKANQFLKCARCEASHVAILSH
jgi:hypothetical protein